MEVANQIMKIPPNITKGIDTKSCLKNPQDSMVNMALETNMVAIIETINPDKFFSVFPFIPNHKSMRQRGLFKPFCLCSS